MCASYRLAHAPKEERSVNRACFSPSLKQSLSNLEEETQERHAIEILSLIPLPDFLAYSFLAFL